jgi:dynactin-6
MASRPPTTKRSTATPYTLPVERPPCNIDPTAVVADKATIIGTFPVEIAEHAVVHPYARIRAEGGRVTIGPYCVIAETAIVGLPEGQRGDVVLDRHVSVESGAEVLAKHVGEVTEVGVQTKIGAGATVGRFCRLTPTEVVQDEEQVQDFTVVFGDGQRRKDTTTLGSAEIQKQRVKTQEKHVEVLKKLIVDGKSKWIE